MYRIRPCHNAIEPAATYRAHDPLRASKNKSFLLRALIISALCGVLAAPSQASVTAIGDVLPADNLLTDPIEGLPQQGNFVDSTQPANAQTNFENNEVVPGYEDINAGIIVGQKAFGRLDIDGNSQLRYQTLVIGDQGMVAGQDRVGSGFVLITGIDALYNNDPNILPAGLPTGFGSVNARDPGDGFDLYVGRYGQGTLNIAGGGRAEIQDAVIVGDQPGSTGILNVDGFASFLSSGGFTASGGPMGEVHQMVVGHYSDGFMTVSTGGTVVSEGTQAGIGDFDTIAAVIGSDAAANETQEPQPGGRGEVNVTGANSSWIIGGSLQVGGFQERGTGGTTSNIEGLNLEYNSEAGRGTLYVQEGGLVSLRPAIGADPEMDDLRLLIGRFGRVVLNNGQIRIGFPGTTMDTVQVLNDGIIEGSGRIDTGIFRNRYLGEVRVGAGEKLLIDSASEFRTPTDLQPLANWGVIQVIGTSDMPAEFEIERAPNAPQDPIRPFLNLRVPRPTGAPPSDFFGGLISAQHSVLRFRSGILNEGMIAFTKGTNYITGEVINLGPVLPNPDQGIINVLGSDVRAIFENDLINAGILNIAGGAVVEVLARHSFVNTGDLQINLNPDSPTHILVGGDAGISGDLAVTISGFSPGTLQVGDTFEIISVAGGIGGVDLTDPLRPRPDLLTNPVFTGVNIVPNLTTFGLPPTAVMIPVFTPHSVLLAIRSTAGIIGADFNGDGFVDAADLAILQMNIGITMGATPLQGDADLDGDVDGDDFLAWQRQLGPVPGSGSGSSVHFAGNVPEPSGLGLLLALAATLAAFQRRKC
jgi:T5SS/PEP-CTERM-associated repeat protein